MVVLPPSTRPGQISAQSIPRSNDFYVPVINLYYPCKTILSAAIITTHSNTIAQLRVHPHVEHLPNVSVARSKIHGVIDFRTRLNTKAVVNVCNLASQTSKVSRSKAGGITLAALDIPCLCAGRKKISRRKPLGSENPQVMGLLRSKLQNTSNITMSYKRNPCC